MTRTRTFIIIGGVAIVGALAIAAPALANLIGGVPPAPSPSVVLAQSTSAPTAQQLSAVSGVAHAPSLGSNVAPPAPVDPAAPTTGLSVTP